MAFVLRLEEVDSSWYLPTAAATSRIRSGDLVSVDGAAGVVQLGVGQSS